MEQSLTLQQQVINCICASYINLLSEFCRCGADMKKPRMGSTKAYVPFGGLIESPQMRHYHKKLF